MFISSKYGIDFFFHNKQIKGKTFNQIKDEVKQGFTETINSIDKKIDDVKPNYKESINKFYIKSKKNVIEKLYDLKKKH